jgi:hypothetical protein
MRLEEMEKRLKELEGQVARLRAIVVTGHGVSKRMRAMAVGEKVTFECRDDNHAASIRGNAYRIFGRGNATAERIHGSRVTVKRLA